MPEPNKTAMMNELESFYEEAARTSRWIEVTQDDIDQFGRATHDHDWMHMDPDRSRRESPFGGTIAFGFWTLSLLTHLVRDTLGADYPPGILYGFNYGFDRVRLMAPVPVGSRIRNHCQLKSIVEKDDGRFLVTTENRIEIENQDKPALVADWVTMLVSG
ncbi:MAG: MaoC family dehydratase [Myxococcota bacterium]